MLPQLEMMGLIPCGFLWIFFKKYTPEVLWESGGQHKLNQDSVRKLPSLIDFSLEMIVSFRIGVGSSLSLYIFFCRLGVIAGLMYSVVFYYDCVSLVLC